MTSLQQKVAEINQGLEVFRQASPEVIGSFKTLRGEACNDKGTLAIG